MANAVLDGTDAVMLSGETAVGRYPEKVAIAAERVCLAAERQPSTRISRHRVDPRFKRVDEAISMSAIYAANHLHIKAIVALTEFGSTPLWMSRIRTAIPIFGLSRHSESLLINWFGLLTKLLFFPVYANEVHNSADPLKYVFQNLFLSSDFV